MTLRHQIDKCQAELEIKTLELQSLKEQLFHEEWEVIAWDDLKEWLKENRPRNDYQSNPVVAPLWTDVLAAERYANYCKINPNGGLQVGPYINDNHIPRGSSMYIRKDRKSWR